MIGVDTASIDIGQSQDFKVHRIVGAANVPALENLSDLDRLPETGATLIALPMKIGKGSGAPTRSDRLYSVTQGLGDAYQASRLRSYEECLGFLNHITRD
jgi:hypothetical protein